MTPTNDRLPSAYDVLAEAYSLVSTNNSTILMIDRAKVLLGIAKEIREDAMHRRMDAALGSSLRIYKNDAVPAREAASPAKPVEIAVDPTIAKLADEHPTMIQEWSKGIVARALDPSTTIQEWSKGVVAQALDYGQRIEDDPADTQRIVAPWAVGDKADCRHCGTPIELFVGDPIQGREGLKVWLHKYTGQAVCAMPITAQQVAEDSVSAHTFAEPTPRG
jgi:hypothetical protein